MPYDLTSFQSYLADNSPDEITAYNPRLSKAETRTGEMGDCIAVRK